MVITLLNEQIQPLLSQELFLVYRLADFLLLSFWQDEMI